MSERFRYLIRVGMLLPDGHVLRYSNTTQSGSRDSNISEMHDDFRRVNECVEELEVRWRMLGQSRGR